MEEFLKECIVDVPPYSHVTYTGGKYFIPPDKYTKFTKLYYRDLVKGKKLYFVERHLCEFNYFQDIDSDAKLTDADINEIILATLAIIPEDTEYIVSKRETRYHINYQYRVSSEQALKITSELHVSGDLLKALDTSVYKNKGLRMLGSWTGKKEKDTSVYKLYDLSSKSYQDLSWTLFSKTLLGAYYSGKSTLPETKMDDQVHTEITNLCKDIQSDIEIKAKVNNVNLLSRYDITPEKIKFVKSAYSGLTKFYISIKDNFCPFMHRQHKRDTNPIYMELSYKGIVLRCYDDNCRKEIYPNEPIKLPLEDPEFVKRYKLLTKYLTVKYYTSEVDNLDDYTRDLLEKSVTGTHYSVAKVIFHLCKNEYRIDEMKNTEWYYFNGVRWVKSHKLHIFISEDLPKYYRSVKIHAADSEEVDESEVFKYNKSLDSLISKLETSPFKKAVMEELKYMFYEMDNEFISKLDSNVYLLGFENGVYDLKKREFRESFPEDYISYTTGYSYIPYNPEDSKVLEIYSFIEKIITNERVREYTLKVLGRGLLGIPDEKFYIWTGLEGSNGKSTLVNLLERTLGDYAIACDTGLLTAKRGSSSNVSPDVYEMKGRRVLMFAEPEKNASLRVGFMKQMTGGDTIKSRDLFKSMTSFKSQGTFIMCTNELPLVNANDMGTWRRIRVTEYTSKFTLDPKKPNEFKIDPDLKEKMDTWLCYFMSILVHYYTRYIEEGNKEPEEVMKATNSYKGDNDNFDEFFGSFIKESEDFTPLRDIYDALAGWWCENYPKSAVPGILEVKRALRLRYGQEKESRATGRIVKGFNVELVSNLSIVEDY